VSPARVGHGSPWGRRPPGCDEGEGWAEPRLEGFLAAGYLA